MAAPAVVEAGVEAPLLRGHWLWGASREAARDVLGVYTDAARLGDVVRLRAAAPIKWYAAFSPSAVERVLHGNQRNYRKPPLVVGAVAQLAGMGLFTLDGDRWLARRRLLQPAFHRERLAALAGLMATAASDTAERWARLAERGARVDVAHEMTRLTLRVASEALFGRDLSDEADAAGAATAAALGHVGYRLAHMPVPLWVPSGRNRRFLAARRVLDALCYRAIDERRAAGGGAGGSGGAQSGAGALLDLLLGARDADTGAALTDRELRDEVMTILLAGHETTAAALAWSWALLAENPGAADALAAEVDAAVGERTPALADLPRLGVARRVFDETLRLYPPAWGQPRQAVADDVLDGVRVPAGALLVLVQWVTHRRADAWDAPERFDPDRFLPERSAGRPRWAYFPFGGGQRLCIGQQFALMEAQLVLATLARRFRVEPATPGRPAADATFALRPRGGLPARIVARGGVASPS
jgi:cytochrome P450